MENDPVFSLCLDLGNTLQKLAIFREDVPEKICACTEAELLSVLENLLREFRPAQSILCSVIPYDPSLEALLSGHTRLIRLDHRTPLPFKNGYEHPSTLGPDRLALAAGAAMEYPGQHTLVIGLGTCITFNFVSNSGEFLGGSISPGLRMRLQSLHDYTGKLPLAEISPFFPLIGYNTNQSILSGVLGGAVAETDGLIDQYRERYRELRVLVSGGDTHFFERHLKNRIFAAPELMFRGLLAILAFNTP